MIQFPILRWGQPYTSLETTQVEHFATGEPVAEVSQATPGLVARDLRKGAALNSVQIAEVLSRDYLDHAV